MPPKTKAAAKAAVADTPMDKPEVTTPPDDKEPAQGDDAADKIPDDLTSEEAADLSAPINEDDIPDLPPIEPPDESGTPDPDLSDERGFAHAPCLVCFPDGWPVCEEGAFVNCAHDFGIRYGESVEITRERAIELGFLSEAE